MTQALDALLDALPAAASPPPRLTLTHGRERRLRPMFFVELLLACALTACLLPLAILLFVVVNALTGGQLFDVEDVLRRAYTEHHVLTLVGPDGARLQLTLDEEAQEAAVMARLLGAVAARRLVLVEQLAGEAAPVTVWDGAAPGRVRQDDPDDAASAAEAEGWTVTRAEGALRLSAVAPPRPKLVAALLLSFGLPFLWWTPAQRAARRALLADWRGEPGERTTLTVSAEALTLTWSRGAWEESLTVPRAALLGLAYQASLSVGEPVERRGPRLRLFTPTQVHTASTAAPLDRAQVLLRRALFL